MILLEKTNYSNYYYPFILHEHKPRNGSLHYDLRFVSPFNEKILWSFAFPKDFKNKYMTKIIGYKTRDHDIRWLTILSYRLKTIDKGKVQYKLFTNKIVKLIFFGNMLDGEYLLFHINKGIRDDKWLLKKHF